VSFLFDGHEAGLVASEPSASGSGVLAGGWGVGRHTRSVEAAVRLVTPSGVSKRVRQLHPFGCFAAASWVNSLLVVI
jgi:hypothetical protein